MRSIAGKEAPRSCASLEALWNYPSISAALREFLEPCSQNRLRGSGLASQVVPDQTYGFPDNATEGPEWFPSLPSLIITAKAGLVLVCGGSGFLDSRIS